MKFSKEKLLCEMADVYIKKKKKWPMSIFEVPIPRD